MDKKYKPERLSEADWETLRPFLRRMQPPYNVRGYEGEDLRRRGGKVAELRGGRVHRYALMSLIPYDNIPVIKALLAGEKAKSTFDIAANAAFMVGRYYNAINPNNDAGAYYDLLAISAAWVNRVDRIKLEQLLVAELRSTVLNHNRFGITCLEKLVRHGLIRLGRNYGGTPGALQGIELAGIVSELIGATLASNVYDYALEDAVPFLGRANTVRRAIRMAKDFHDLAVVYYGSKGSCP